MNENNTHRPTRMYLPAAAEYLGVPEGFLHRLVWEKRIAYYKRGPGERYTPACYKSLCDIKPAASGGGGGSCGRP